VEKLQAFIAADVAAGIDHQEIRVALASTSSRQQ